MDVPLDAKQIYRAQQFCDANDIGLVVIGPEDPLAAGMADGIAKAGDGSTRPVLGPSARAARLEADKAYAKKLMRDASCRPARGARSPTTRRRTSTWRRGRSCMSSRPRGWRRARA
jgi:phosphoribosylamine--glycine ligase